MPAAERAAVVACEDRRRESFGDPALGDVSWFTLVSGDLTASRALSAGLMELPPGGAGLAFHRHAQPEIYHVIEGEGVVTVDGDASAVAGGATVYIPGDAEHGLRNAGSGVLKVFYVFPADRFSEVVYRFSDPLPPVGPDG